jgi:hypothetical protein
MAIRYDGYGPKGTARDRKLNGVSLAKAAKLAGVDSTEVEWSIEECGRCDTDDPIIVEAGKRQLSTPASFYFLQITDRHVNGGAQVDFELDFTFGWSTAKPDDFSTQRKTPEHPGRMRANAALRGKQAAIGCHARRSSSDAG